MCARIFFAACLTASFLFSHGAFAAGGVEFSEIMYDVEGSDTDREWVEVFNAGGESVDISGYRFFEGTSNHKLALVQGSSVIPSGGYAVIAENASVFASEHAGFSGVLFDSSFSLSNTGETLVLRDQNLADLDSVTYASSMGANGDGMSLQKNGGVWIAALPTPGTGANSATTPSAGAAQESASDSQTAVSSLAPQPVIPRFAVDAGSDQTGIAGGEIHFTGKALGYKREPLDGGRFLWNFGDGSIAEGSDVKHIYAFPGTYMVSLNVSSGLESESAYIRATIEKSMIQLSEVSFGSDGFVELWNGSNHAADISGWIFRDGRNGPFFSMPEGTAIPAQAAAVFPNSITRLFQTAPLSASGGVFLLYPNNVTALQVLEGERVIEGGSYQKTADGTYVFSTTQTPGVFGFSAASEKAQTRVTAPSQTQSGSSGRENSNSARALSSAQFPATPAAPVLPADASSSLDASASGTAFIASAGTLPIFLIALGISGICAIGFFALRVFSIL